ncbi:MAG: uracil-DNA glycosylase [Methanothrix sp.]|jgi:DNA polymerase|uniref:Type-4 uracil-DNA glycosylase n=1 Tax=Methanothrix thermoacetophila (strain DSM 6194 / JCM 14653 / NBRC 101360 / PT) TaxID=349307 RepID=A0B978_METTP|nr:MULTISPECIES: uracil-DNA glycosylase [Methanothrix]ABK15252.1 phage SPO1 DNA polymerase-related protein [Methanothrix thermoacetophila PT]MBC7079161.1 uracil-DNA glycosylase [Methanothrix sp.]NPU86625.1 uracil-DNA glycosylase [Methanothrix sp.]
MCANDLRELACEIVRCERCGLSKTRRNAVPGEGPEDARIMMIGEAPGAAEDLAGRPFVGRAGAILNRALNLAGLDRDEIFITNIVKCRPPGNRQPSADEIRACMPYLRKQIEMVRPSAICLLGNVPARAILGVQGVTALRGRVFDDLYLITFHPAAVLRNMGRMELFVSDLVRLREMRFGSNVR